MQSMHCAGYFRSVARVSAAIMKNISYADTEKNETTKMPGFVLMSALNSFMKNPYDLFHDSLVLIVIFAH